MTALQIVLLAISGAFALTSIVFMILFIVEISVSPKEAKKEVEVKSIFSSETYVKEVKNEESVDSMLAKLDEQAEEKKDEVKEEIVEEEVKEEVVEEKAEVVEDKKEDSMLEALNEAAEESVEEKAEETTEVVEENAEETPVEESKEEVVEETTEETVEEAPVEEKTEEVVEEEKVEESAPVEETPAEEPETVEVGSVVVEGEPITAANLLDYKARLASVIESRDKLNKDLIKIEKSILNYERTKRRKIRNQKMLDRRASELTNLNLVMYSVTDIKNVDEDKKVKQEELTTHIAELKASIQDADEFLDSNKEKNEHDIKMAKFLIQEKARFKEEIAELEALIAKTEGNGTATVA
ncbi:MAG: hypothetical protein IKJ33_02650 [Clostridia bacterium]|nr:hypothetical protein [Clostridia bacterium]